MLIAFDITICMSMRFFCRFSLGGESIFLLFVLARRRRDFGHSPMAGRRRQEYATTIHTRAAPFSTRAAALPPRPFIATLVSATSHA